MAQDVAPSVRPTEEQSERAREAIPKPKPTPLAWRTGYIFGSSGERTIYQVEVDGLLWITVKAPLGGEGEWEVAVHRAGNWGSADQVEGPERFRTRESAEARGFRMASRMLAVAMRRMGELAGVP